jgi:hypothetical protein
MQPVIAVIGSVNPLRTYDPPMANAAEAEEAAVAIGGELALRGCRILVFSSRPEYVEQAVVRGYVESGHAVPGAIEVRARYGADTAFPEMDHHPHLFLVQPEPTADWEVTFYRSLLSIDGVVLIGGGRSTFVAGLIALSRDIALAPVAAFGGAAERVWRRLSGSQAAEEDRATLAQPWQVGAAETVASALLAQHVRRLDAAERSRRAGAAARRRTTYGLLFSLLLLLLALSTVPLAFALPAGRWPGLTVLVVAAFLASIWGAVIRNAYDDGAQWLRSAALGSAAGSVAFLLFVAAQMSTNSDLFASDGVRQLIFFVLAISFIGGFTSEVVYRKLRDQDVTETSAVSPPAL